MKIRKNITISKEAIKKAQDDSKAKYDGKENVSKHIEDLILNHKIKKRC